MTMEILILVFVFFLGYLSGWQAHAKILIKRLLDNPDGAIKILEKYKKNLESAHENLINIEVEEINNLFYVYVKENGEFLGQSPSRDDIENFVKNRFPNQKFKILEKSR